MRKGTVAASIWVASNSLVIASAVILIAIEILPFWDPVLRGLIGVVGIVILFIFKYWSGGIIQAASQFEKDFWKNCAEEESEERMLAAVKHLLKLPDHELSEIVEENLVDVCFDDEVVAQIEFQTKSCDEIRKMLDELVEKIEKSLTERTWPIEPKFVKLWRENILPIFSSRTTASS